MEQIKKYLCIIFLVLLCPSLLKSQNLAQTDTLKGFWGIPFSTPKKKVILLLKKKGVSVEPSISDTNQLITVRKEMFGGRQSYTIIFSFYKETFCKASVFYKTGKPKICDDFLSVMNQINHKYFMGKRSAKFKYPYEEDGEDKEFAIAAGYGALFCEWNFAMNQIILSTFKVQEDIYLSLEYVDTFHSDLLRNQRIIHSDY
jgi:hypothetical protein